MKHGKRGTREYFAWANMLARCSNPKHPVWKYYGGRGITVCKRWRTFTNFLDDMGRVPVGMSLERSNNNKGYKPSNCRWATRSEQMRNQRKVIFVNGMCLKDAAAKAGVSYDMVRSRQRKGLPMKDWFKPSTRQPVMVNGKRFNAIVAKAGLPYDKAYMRMKRGWPQERWFE